jgi:hypothetical protein
MFVVPAMAQLYKCKDADGNIVYTDEPCVGGERLKLPPLPTYTPGKLPALTPSADKNDKEKDNGYRSLEITSPEDDSVIRDNTGTVTISYTTKPALKSALGHKFAVAIDGTQLKTKGTTNQIRLSDIERGTHTIQIHVVDKKDKVLISSKPVTFHMKRHSILHKTP